LFNGYHYDANETGGAVIGPQNPLHKQLSDKSSFNGSISNQTTQTLSASMGEHK